MSAGDDRSACRACRGTGKLRSSLGGTPHEVTCPWCEGTGQRIPGLDAQEHPSEGARPGAETDSAASEDTDAAPPGGEAIEENAASEDDDLS